MTTTGLMTAILVVIGVIAAPILVLIWLTPGSDPDDDWGDVHPPGHPLHDDMQHARDLGSTPARAGIPNAMKARRQ